MQVLDVLLFDEERQPVVLTSGQLWLVPSVQVADMTWLELIWLAAVGGCVTLGTISLQQAKYFDGDRDAHTDSASNHVFSTLAYTPRHPYAARAKRRGVLLLGVGVAGLLIGALLRTVS